ncbi:helix-turn-helix domain-containing protein [Pelobacter propionicus]|uniref:Transcriptional regulator, XRE family n=1 Tax=Pelobacter propionicus (strain DSM 2379 / NBRC 103807 / OttBd1) TaxID=338966 RepID=A1AN21_PELPD|nr:helix-turn-helix transcriptional regulator [Pelobacter propionicus]ABK98741.1 transcriptional regulator, XRE family [Pelobacter propionicus DSM 2379]
MAKGSGSGKTPERLVEYINKAIAEKGQKALEIEVGLSTSMISRYKRGIGEPTASTLQKFADYFGVSVWELRGDDFSLELNKMSTSYETSNGTISENIDIDSINGETKKTLLRLSKDLLLDILSRATGSPKEEKQYVVSLNIENGKLVGATARPIAENETDTNAGTASNRDPDKPVRSKATNKNDKRKTN